VRFDLRRNEDIIERWQQLRVTRALQGASKNLPGATEAAAILTAARRASTWRGYGSKVRKYLTYCLQVVPAYGQPALRPVPAQPAQILAYIGWLLKEEAVSSASLQGYLSAVSSLHQDLGYPSPTVGKLMVEAKRGFSELEATTADPLGRRPLPCQVIWQIVQLGLDSKIPEVVRAAACVALNACFFCRSDTGITLRRSDVMLTEDSIQLRERHLKNVSRRQLVVLSRQTSRTDPVVRLLQKFDALAAQDEGCYWRLAGERSALWSSSRVDDWLQLCLGLVGAVPPPGVSWSSHSLRSGGATGAHSVGVQDHVICRWGVWASLRSLSRYVDALTPPSQEAFLLFSHLLRPSVDDLRSRWGGGEGGGAIAVEGAGLSV